MISRPTWSAVAPARRGDVPRSDRQGGGCARRVLVRLRRAWGRSAEPRDRGPRRAVGPSPERPSRASVSWRRGSTTLGYPRRRIPDACRATATARLTRGTRRGRPCGGSARRPCRRRRRASSVPSTTAASAIAPPVRERRCRRPGSDGRLSVPEHVVLGARGSEPRAASTKVTSSPISPGADALARAVEARHPPGDVAAAVVGDHQHDEQGDRAAEAELARVCSAASCSETLGEPDRPRPAAASSADEQRRRGRRPRASRRTRRPS